MPHYPQSARRSATVFTGRSARRASAGAVPSEALVTRTDPPSIVVLGNTLTQFDAPNRSAGREERAGRRSDRGERRAPRPGFYGSGVCVSHRRHLPKVKVPRLLARFIHSPLSSEQLLEFGTSNGAPRSRPPFAPSPPLARAHRRDRSSPGFREQEPQPRSIGIG